MPTLVATALPTPPANVQAAQQVIGQQPYANLIIQLSQSPLGNANADNTLSAAQLTQAAQSAAKALAAGTVPSSEVAQYQALYAFLPAYIQAAQTVDAYNNQYLVPTYGPMPNYTEMGQATQSLLQQFFSLAGLSSNYTTNNSTTGSGITGTGVIVIAGVALLLILVVSR